MRLSEYGLCVRRLRLESGATLREMAAALSISSSYLSSIEFGERALTEKISTATINYFSPNISSEKMAELIIACDKTMKTVPVSMLNGSDKNLVAAFARRLSDGHGIPDDVLAWIKEGGKNDGSE